VPDRIAHAYVAGLERHVRAVLAGAALAVATAAYLIATRLPIRADFSYLLPKDAPAIRDLRWLEERLPAKDTTLILVVAHDPAARAAATAQLLAGLHAIDPALVERIEADDGAARAAIRAHRWLYAPLGELTAVRDALARRIRDTNPLFVDLDPEPDRLAELRAGRRTAERELARSSFVSADGLTQLVIVRTPFRATDVPRDRALAMAIDAVFARVRAAVPGIQLGLAGGAPTAIAEHDAVARGMVLSSIVTSLLVALVLLVHLRRFVVVALVGLQIIVATAISFGLAALTVGHLNAATAFLGAIIAGNGINYGILLVARYLEERSAAATREAVARAIAATLRPTLVAALGASIAYGALAVTRFRGFADFALIGGLGMLVCWIIAYTVLPVLLLLAGRARLPAHRPLFGAIVERTAAVQRPARVRAVAAVAAVTAGVVAARFIAGDPFEYDMTRLRSDAPAALEARRWLEASNAAFGRGVIGRTYLAVDRDDQVGALVAALQAARATADGAATIGRIESILDLVPAEQDAKLAVLGDVRRLLDEPAIDALDDDARAELRELRPPDGLRAVTLADLPPEALAGFRERDGAVGRIVAVRPAQDFAETDGHAMLRFTAAIRTVQLPRARVVTSGASLVYADILAINRADGPLVTATAGLGLVIMVLAVVGRNRKAAAVLAATALGSLAMVATCALAGLRINFLDFVALPIALGLGVDYAINVAERIASDDPLHALRTTGGTVLVCSLTTIIGYASILFSANQAIRDFGLASLIGEITCVVTALTLVPALLGRRVRC
jgi:predicted RND superfamily exporter protein